MWANWELLKAFALMLGSRACYEAARPRAPAGADGTDGRGERSGAAAARQAHNLEAVGSNPTSATREGEPLPLPAEVERWKWRWKRKAVSRYAENWDKKTYSKWRDSLSR